jgi:hypothetical protein
MRYKLLKDLLWLKAGEIIKTLGEDDHYNDSHEEPTGVVTNLELYPNYYPDFFEPISEEEEKVKEAMRLLESKGYLVAKKLDDLNGLNKVFDSMFGFK